MIWNMLFHCGIICRKIHPVFTGRKTFKHHISLLPDPSHMVSAIRAFCVSIRTILKVLFYIYIPRTGHTVSFFQLHNSYSP